MDPDELPTQSGRLAVGIDLGLLSRFASVVRDAFLLDTLLCGSGARCAGRLPTSRWGIHLSYSRSFCP